MGSSNRDEAGRFLESPDSLHPKIIGLRLPKRDYPRFEALAEVEGVSLAELARRACLNYLNQKADIPS